MDPVSRTGRLRQTTRLTARAKPQAQASSAQTGDATPAPPSVAAQVVQRLAALDPNEPQRRQRAMRIFLEGGLLDTFGAQALMEPAFQQMIDEVQESMRADAKLAEATEMLIDRLLDGLHNGQAQQELDAAFKRQRDGTL